MLKITLCEHYWAYVTDTTLMVEPLPGNGRLKLLHNLYNHGVAPIVRRRVNVTIQRIGNGGVILDDNTI